MRFLSSCMDRGLRRNSFRGWGPGGSGQPTWLGVLVIAFRTRHVQSEGLPSEFVRKAHPRMRQHFMLGAENIL